jgi:hypothetical protein
MKMKYMATVLAAVAPLLGTAAPASAAEGRPRWIADGSTWHEYTPPGER